MSIKQSKIWESLCSIKLAIWLLSIIAALSIIGTLIPQNNPVADYMMRYGENMGNFLSKTGLTNMYSSWWFILLLGLLTLNLTSCVFNRLLLRNVSLGTLISHVSILVIFAGALVGMFFGERGFLAIREGETMKFFNSSKKSPDNNTCVPIYLDFSLRLDDFIYDEYIDPEEKLLVYSKSGDIITELPVELDKELMVGETGYSVRVLRYVPDFVMDIETKEVVTRSSRPNNPAMQIEVKGPDNEVNTSWVFAAFPEMGHHLGAEAHLDFRYQWKPRKPKDYTSRVTVIQGGKEVKSQDIRVNFPLKFGGYAFFQSSYDADQLSWSEFQVVKDPGVPIVYFGFILLVLGLGIRFYGAASIKI